jgi:betaine-aldehyde dehydrogenase
MRIRERLFLGGVWVAPSGSAALEVVDPTREIEVGRVPRGSARDVNGAVAAARAAFDGWSRTPPRERAKFLEALARALAERRDELARGITEELGMPFELSKRVQAGLPASVMASFAQLAAEFRFEQELANSLVVRAPLGVVGCITPWNYPLHQIVLKVGAALAAGCTVVLKPSEQTPLCAFEFADLVERCGLPPGVFNLVSGVGAEAGEALASHADLDALSFTGSTRAGRRVGELAARNVVRVTLELGGKSPNLVLDDADLPRAVKHGVGACFLNSGQTCSALSRLLVPRERVDEAAKLAVAAARTFTVGDPFEPSTRLGPLVSGAQRERVRELLRSAIADGAKLECGGPDAPANTPRGFFVQPTVFSHVAPTLRIAREEIFGPVLSIFGYDDEEHAIAIANDTEYGLAAAVWSSDNARAERVARRLRAGQVDLNGGKFNPLAPFGGFKRSGHGREGGVFGLEEFLTTQSLQR